MSDNFIIHQQAKKYQWYGECFLSVKSFYNGVANYQVKQREYTVDKSNFLILNECTNYRLTIDSAEMVESFCVFFSPEFVSGLASELNSSDEQLLDFNMKKCGGIRLFERNYRNMGLVSELLKKGRVISNSGFSSLEKDELYHLLLNAILQKNTSAIEDSKQLASKKRSTREEIYQRVYYVKDFIDSNFTKNLRLKDLAGIGLLSENHLLRNFNRIIGSTPFQYVSQKRIQEAKRQIQETNKSIKEISQDVGYTSMGNFSTYFKVMVGKSPSSFRKK